MTATRKHNKRTRWAGAATLVTSTAFVHGYLDSCNDRIVEVTRFVDPCGTFLANCNPGDFQVNAADIGDYCIDPACTIPGGCGNAGPALGTVTQLCP